MAGVLNPNGSPAPHGPLPTRRENAVAGWGALLLLPGLLWGAGGNPCLGEQKAETKLLFLVARGPVVDPFFKHSVVLDGADDRGAFDCGARCQQAHSAAPR